MPMDPSMGIPQDAPIMQAYGGRKANVFDAGSQLYSYDNSDVDFTNMYSDNGWYKPAVKFVLDNWEDERVQNWIRDVYVPRINAYNSKRAGYTPITADDVTKASYGKYSFDGKFGAWHIGNGDLDQILDISPQGVFSGTWKDTSAPPEVAKALAVTPVSDTPALATPALAEAVTATPAPAVTQTRRDYYLKPDGGVELMPEYWKGRAPEGYTVDGVDYTGKTYNDVFGVGMGRVYKDSTTRDPVEGVQYTDHYWGDATPADPSQSKLGRYPTWLRYAEPFGQLGLVLTDALGLTNKPDTDDIDAAVSAIQTGGAYRPITFNPIGDYRRYRPLDRDYYLNKLNAEAGATRRGIMTVSGGNRGSAIAGLLSADYNTQQSIGDTLMKQELANRQHEGEVAEFNRDTNKFNATGIFEADKTNQQAL